MGGQRKPWQLESTIEDHTSHLLVRVIKCSISNSSPTKHKLCPRWADLEERSVMGRRANY
jgi:hypothetical protein